MNDLTEQEVCIGSLGQQKVYLKWSDVKDICTNAVSEAYEQVKEENAQLKEQINKYFLDAINRGTANAVKAVKEFGMPERIEELVKQNKELKERCERLEEALFEAVCTLETYADTENWRDIFEEDGDDSEYHSEALYFADEGYEAARSALKQIKDLEK